MFGLSLPLDAESFPKDEEAARPVEENGFFTGAWATSWLEHPELKGLWIPVHANLKSTRVSDSQILNLRSFTLNALADNRVKTKVIPEELIPRFGFPTNNLQRNNKTCMMEISHGRLLHPPSAKIIKQYQEENPLLVRVRVSRNQGKKPGVLMNKDTKFILCSTGPMLFKKNTDKGDQGTTKNYVRSLKLPIKISLRGGEAKLRADLDQCLGYAALRFLGVDALDGVDTLISGSTESQNILDSEQPVDSNFSPIGLPFIGFETGVFTQAEQAVILTEFIVDANGTDHEKAEERARRLFEGRIVEESRGYFEGVNSEALRFHDTYKVSLPEEPAEPEEATQEIPIGEAPVSEPNTERLTEETSEPNVTQPGSISLLNDSLRLILEESIKISGMDFSDLETSEKDKDLIETLNAKLANATEEAEKLHGDKRNLNLTVEKLIREAKESVESTNKKISQMREAHRKELAAQAAQDEERRRALLEEIDEFNETVRKLTVSRDGFKAAATAEFDVDQLDYISKLSITRDKDAREATELIDLMESENEELRRKMVQLETKLSWYRMHDAEASVLEQTEGIGEEEVDITLITAAFKNNLDLYRYADENLKYLSISPDALTPAKSLDGFERSKSWSKKALHALLSLNDYAEKMVKDEISASFVDFASSSDAKFQIPRHKIAMESSTTGTKTSSYRRTRTFSVSEDEQWVGDREIECFPHIRIDQALPGPRIYFSDDTIKSNQKLFVGYYGEHLRNVIPTSVS
ncbi:hypothetical protein DQ353_16270 [Arthrobacter sp. AQ5-05]|uniref:hypothetical protein n=1 Tax=Arthrobacter sp. AQ5-05 TaxID=2184581 RepID=UPI000DCB1E0E|nr:hypothetical protein [Arthrobacter sp. AQ5-05]RAX48241.1 hypothetical protein DQ353_16270 [Arthrobacter sp. AQ5-05]